MKKITVLLSVLALTVFVNARAQTSAPATDPQQDITKVIEFTDLDHNFGKIPQGKPVEYDVILKNVSGDSVKIENVQVGCGCTTPKWKPNPPTKCFLLLCRRTLNCPCAARCGHQAGR